MVFWKGLTFRPAVTALCVLLLAAVLLLQFLGGALQGSVANVNIEPAEGIEMAVLRPDARKVFQYKELNQLFAKKDSCFDPRFVLDARTFGGAYSEGLKPVYNDISEKFSYGGTAADMVILIGTCTEVTEYAGFANYIDYRYTFDVLETVYKSEWNSADIKTVKYDDTTDQPSALAEVGKTYLFWGHCTARSNGELIFHCSLLRGMGGAEKKVEQQGVTHVLKETDYKSNNFVPLISELTGSLEEFMQTEVGKIWEETIFAKAKACDHSVSVIGTDCLESIPAWHAGDCVLTAGQMFSEEQYENGEQVCMISEELAAANGLAVGDSLPLSLYAALMFFDLNRILYYHITYDPLIGFADEGNFRIVGLYRSSCEMEEGYPIHPNTVFIPNGAASLLREQNDKLGLTVDAKYSASAFSYILPENGWLDFELQAETLGYSGWFVHWDGIDEASAAQNERLQAAYGEWSDRVDKAVRYLPVCTVPSVAVLMLAFVLSKKKEIGHLYGIRTPMGTLFAHIFAQSLVIGAAAFVLSLSGAVLLLPVLVPAVLRPMADPTFVETLIAKISVMRLPSLTVLITAVLLLLAAALVCSLIGAKRRYQFEYHEKE